MLTTAGIISSGKSSLTAILAEQLGTKAYFEPVTDNPVLPLFYKGNEILAKKRAAGDKEATNPYAFLLQIYFLNRRFRTIKDAVQQDNNVVDRSIYEDELFCRLNADLGNMTQEEYGIYKNLLANMMEELPLAAHKKAPDLMVMIDVSYETMLKRVKKRGREYEQIENDPSLVQYYKTLLKYYAEWKRDYKYSPLLVIDGDKYDFMESLDDRKTVLKMVYDQLLALNSIDMEEYQRLIKKLDTIKLTRHEGEYDVEQERKRAEEGK